MKDIKINPDGTGTITETISQDQLRALKDESDVKIARFKSQIKGEQRMIDDIQITLTAEQAINDKLAIAVDQSVQALGI